MTKTIETEEIEVVYETVNQSFDHAFGRMKQSGFEIRTIKAYIPALNDWLDVTHMSEFYALADKLIVNELEKAA